MADNFGFVPDSQSPSDNFGFVPDAQQPVSKLKSAALGASQGASLNFGDEGSAAVVALAKKLTGQGGNFMDNYVKARDALRQSIGQAQTANPKTFMAGELAGGAAMTPIAGEMTIPKMAAMGGAQALGSSTADLTTGQPKEFAKAAGQTALGAGVGATVGALANAFNPEAMSAFAKNRAMKALGFTKRLINTTGKNEGAENAAQTMLDEGVITPMATPQEMADRTSQLLQTSGSKIGDYLKSQGKGYDPAGTIDAINALRPKDASGNPLTGGYYDKANSLIDTAIDTIKSHGDGPLPFDEANKIKTLLQSVVNWNSTKAESGLGKSIAGATRESIDQQLQNISGAGPEYQDFLKNKLLYGAGQRVEPALENRLSSELGNKSLSLTDLILMAGAGGGELATGHTPIGALASAAATVAAKRFLEKYGNQLGAVGANQLSQIPQAAIQYGIRPAAYGAETAANRGLSDIIDKYSK